MTTHTPTPTRYTIPPTYAVRELLHLIHHAKQHPADLYIISSSREQLTAPQVLTWFRLCLARKINRNLPPPRGRKCAGDGYLSDYERGACQLAHRVNTPRLIVRETEVPTEFRERLKHRLYREEDF